MNARITHLCLYKVRVQESATEALQMKLYAAINKIARDVILVREVSEEFVAVPALLVSLQTHQGQLDLP